MKWSFGQRSTPSSAIEVKTHATAMSVKQKNAVLRDVPVDAETAGGAQSAVSRRAADAQLRSLVSEFAPQRLRLVAAIRRSLRQRLPSAHELVYEYRDFVVISYSPNDHGYEGVLAIHAGANGVRLYFNQGKELPDPEKLLQGAGKQTRSISIEAASTLTRPAVASLIDEAIARNRVPFALAGLGSVTIRSTTAKKRRPQT